jgi:hypothetical protein
MAKLTKVICKASQEAQDKWIKDGVSGHEGIRTIDMIEMSGSEKATISFLDSVQKAFNEYSAKVAALPFPCAKAQGESIKAQGQDLRDSLYGAMAGYRPSHLQALIKAGKLTALPVKAGAVKVAGVAVPETDF